MNFFIYLFCIIFPFFFFVLHNETPKKKTFEPSLMLTITNGQLWNLDFKQRAGVKEKKTQKL